MRGKKGSVYYIDRVTTSDGKSNREHPGILHYLKDNAENILDNVRKHLFDVLGDVFGLGDASSASGSHDTTGGHHEWAKGHAIGSR